MTPPLEALLRYAFAEDRAQLRPVLDYLHQSARRAGVPEPEDEAQRLCFHLFGSPALTRAFFEKLAGRNPDLASALVSAPAGTVPAFSPDLVDPVIRQIAAYVGGAFRNAIVGAHRRRRTEPLPDDDQLQGSTELELASDLPAVRRRVLSAIESETDRPAWLDPAVEAIEALATGDATMEGLTQACIASDPSLGELAPEAARIRARNRLQQQHKRAREHLAATVQRLVHAGGLDDEQARSAELWIGLLIRRQNPPAGPSRRSKP
jgi:hypothetical protein